MDIMDLFGPVAANDNDKRVCLECSASLFGRQKKFCSVPCKDTHKARVKSNRLADERIARPNFCEQCDVPVPVIRGVKAARFCSAKCRSKAHRGPGMAELASCDQCGHDFIKTREAARFCGSVCKRRASDIRNADKRNASRLRRESRRVADQPIRQCEWCGDDYRALNKGNEPRFCSKSCSTSNSGRETYIKGLLDGKYVYPRVSVTTYRPYCVGCGNRFTSHHGRTFCTDTCRDLHSVGKWREYAVANDNVDRSPRPCAECGTVFSTSYGDTRTTYCSRECGKRNAHRVAKHKRRAIERGVSADNVDPIAVLERDGWQCQICGIDTPREKRGTCESDAPEVDHITPLAKGGSHTYDNVQCACRQCNAAKSDTLPMAA